MFAQGPSFLDNFMALPAQDRWKAAGETRLLVNCEVKAKTCRSLSTCVLHFPDHAGILDIQKNFLVFRKDLLKS